MLRQRDRERMRGQQGCKQRSAKKEQARQEQAMR
jgi:hypothetical protein